MHESTGQSPAYLCMGFQPRGPLDALVGGQADDRNETAHQAIEHMRHDLARAKKHMEAAREHQKKYADWRRRHEEFEEGQRVLLSTEHLNTRGRTRKLGTGSVGH